MCRSLLLPMFGLLGSAFAVASAQSAVDIVLNSVAIGFIFELDNLLYLSALSDRTRRDYERAAPERGTVLEVGGSARVCAWWSCAFVMVDLFFMGLGYIDFASSTEYIDVVEGVPDYWFWTYWQAGQLVYARAGLWAAVGWHLAARRNARKLRSSVESTVRRRSVKGGGHQPLSMCVRLVLSAVITVGTAFFGYKIVYQGLLVQTMGFSDSCIQPGSPMDTCLKSYEKIPECIDVELNYTLPGEQMFFPYTYEDGPDVLWSMYNWGPVTYNCLPARLRPRS